jgi:hypothetical protein
MHKKTYQQNLQCTAVDIISYILDIYLHEYLKFGREICYSLLRGKTNISETAVRSPVAFLFSLYITLSQCKTEDQEKTVSRTA